MSHLNILLDYILTSIPMFSLFTSNSISCNFQEIKPLSDNKPLMTMTAFTYTIMINGINF